MGASADVTFEVQLTAGVWTDITPHTIDRAGLNVKYGIFGNGPLDCVAGTGIVKFTMRNDAGIGAQGYYSPLNANVRAGWGFGVPFRAVFHHLGDTVFTVSSLTRSGTTATAVTSIAHGYTTGQWVTVAGADQGDYNGTVQITVTDVDQFTYAVANSPATPATGTISAQRAYVKGRGKIRSIDPDAGQFGPQQVRVTAYDGMRDLAEADCREVGLAIGKSESELVTDVLDSLVSDSQPVARDIDAGVDVFPFAFDDLQSGVKALAVIKDVCVGAFALVAMKGDGTFILRSRHSRAVGSSSYHFNNSMHGLAVPSDLSGLWNLVRVTIRPKVPSASATDELYTLPDGHTVTIPAGETVEVWTDYSDPNNRQQPVGGESVVTALVAHTHYEANTQTDGGGSDVTPDISPTLTAFASTAKWSLTNTGAALAYLTIQKVIGKAVRNPGPQTFQSYAAKSYGVRELPIELRYQSDSSIAQSYADYVRAQYDSLVGKLDVLTFIANADTDLLTQALEREPGDIITITEPVTGVDAVEAVIQWIELDITPGPWIVCRFGLSPSAPFQAWLLGIAGRGELGEATRLGF